MAVFIDRVALQNYIDEMPEISIKEIRAKVIDEFAERAKTIGRPIGCDCKENIPLYAHADGTWHDLIADIAEQMKGEQHG